jgi:hypothetical protein
VVAPPAGTAAVRSERAALVDRYRRGSAVVLEALTGATEAELDTVPAGGGWSARQVVHHLADAETMAATRLRRLLAEDAPVIQAYPEEVFAARLRYDRPIATSLAVIAAVRAASAELLELLDDADWQRAGTHTEEGMYSVVTWLATYVAHAEDHARQITAARSGR